MATFIIKGATPDDLRKPTIKDPVICECGKKLTSTGQLKRHFRKCEKTKDVANALDGIIGGTESGSYKITDDNIDHKMDITKNVREL